MVQATMETISTWCCAMGMSTFLSVAMMAFILTQGEPF
jgi:hypothetical protein